MFRTKIAFILLFVMVAAIAGCGGDGKKENGESVDNSMTDSTDFVAKVNNVPIGDKEVSQELTLLRQQMAGRVSAQQLDSMEPMLKQQAVANLVNRILLTQAAESENITVTAEQVDAKYEEIKANFPDEETFVAQLSRGNLTPEEFRVEVERARRTFRGGRPSGSRPSASLRQRKQRPGSFTMRTRRDSRLPRGSAPPIS